MNFNSATLTTFLTLSSLLISVGCAKKDINGKALSSHLSRPGKDSCDTTTKTKSLQLAKSDFERKGRKLLVAETESNEFGISSAEISHQMIAKNRELVVVLNELCASQHRSEITENIHLPKSLHSERSHLVKVSESLSIAELESIVESDPCILGVGDNVIMEPTYTANDPQFSQLVYHTNMKSTTGWDVFYGASGGITQEVIVAIIDSGVDTDHPDLAASMWQNPGETPNNNVDDDNNGYVDDVNGYNFASNMGNPNPQPWTGQNAGGENHGTHCAGLSAAKLNNSVGVAGVSGLKTKIMALNVFGAVAGAQLQNIDNAIRYAADKGANVINMSLGGRGASSSTSSAIAYAINKGVVVIAAAGNDNVDIRTTFFSPASYGQQYAGMMAVGAIDATNSAKCSFSNHSNTYVEIGAPGCENGGGILSTFINGYGRMAGTSMASPLAAGAAAVTYGLIWSRTGQKPTPSVVEEVMTAGARVEAALTGSFKAGKVVDLDLLSKEVNRRFPAGGTPAPTPAPPGTPGDCE